MGRLLNLAFLLPILVMLAFGFAIWGWIAQGHTLGLTVTDAFYRAIGSVTLSTPYDKSANWGGDWRLNAARVIGAGAFLIAASQAFTRLLSLEIATYLGRFRRNHLLVVGDHPLARTVVQAAIRRHAKVTWIANSDIPPDALSGALIIPHAWDRRLALRFRADRAARSVVAFADEVQQIAAVRDLRAAAPLLPITMNFGDAWFAERMDELENISGVRFVSQVQLSVRDLHWRQPPFLLAERMGHDRLHAVIFGFGRGGEAVMTDLLLCCLAGSLGKPMITIIDPRAAEVRRSLAQRCPALGESIDYLVIDPGSTSDVRVLPVAELAAAEACAPITMAYVCVDNDARAMALAVSLQAVFRREGWRTGPIFTRLISGGALPDVPAGINDTTSAGLVAFGGTGDFAHAIGLFDSDTDAMPRMFHEAYRRTAPQHAVANLPWEELAEELRESNRRLLIHLPAKLATAGVDVAAWLARAGLDLAGQDDMPLPDLDTNPDLLEQLAALEHARWMMERHIGGWQYGATRDNSRRLHPDLKPYAELDEKVRTYDRTMVKEAWTALASSAGTGFFPSGGGMKRPEPPAQKASRAA
jgi:hypothetical protein